MSLFITGITDIVVMYAGKFQKGEINLSFFCKFESPLEIMNVLYNNLTITNQLQRIDELPKETKLKLWNDAKDICPNGSQHKVIKICNAIWLLNSIMEQ